MNSVRLSLLAGSGLIAAALAPSFGLAQTPPGEVVSTAQGGTGATPPAAATSSAASTAVATTGPNKTDLAGNGPLPDHKIHGEVSVGVGTNGYKEVSGEVEGPIGQDGQVMIAIDAGSENGPRSR